MQDPTKVEIAVKEKDLDQMFIDLAARTDLVSLKITIEFESKKSDPTTPLKKDEDEDEDENQNTLSLPHQQKLLALLEQNYHLQSLSIFDTSIPGKHDNFSVYWGKEQRDLYSFRSCSGNWEILGKGNWSTINLINEKVARNRFVHRHKTFENTNADSFRNPFERAMNKFIEENYKHFVNNRYVSFPGNGELLDYLNYEGLSVFLEMIARRGEQLKGVDLFEFVPNRDISSESLDIIIPFLIDNKRPLPFTEIRIGGITKYNLKSYLTLIENLPHTRLRTLEMASVGVEDEDVFKALLQTVITHKVCTEIDVGVCPWKQQLQAAIAHNQREAKKEQRLRKVNLASLFGGKPISSKESSAQLKIDDKENLLEPPVNVDLKKIPNNIAGEIRRCKKLSTQRNLQINFQVQQETEVQQELEVTQQIDLAQLLQQRLEEQVKVKALDTSYTDVLTRKDIKPGMFLKNNIFSEYTLLRIWDNVVGTCNDRVLDKSHVIEGLSRKAFEQLLQTPQLFNAGVDLDQLPYGFFLKVQKNMLVLDYSEHLALNDTPSVFRQKVKDTEKYVHHNKRRDVENRQHNPHEPRIPADFLLKQPHKWVANLNSTLLATTRDDINQFHLQNKFDRNCVAIMLYTEEQFSRLPKEKAYDLFVAMLNIYRFSQNFNIPMTDRAGRFTAEFSQLLLAAQRDHAPSHISDPNRDAKERESKQFVVTIEKHYKDFVRSISTAKSFDTFIPLMQAEDAKLADNIIQTYGNILREFNFDNFCALSHVLFEEGCVGVAILCHQFSQLGNNYNSFKRCFIDPCHDFTAMMSDDAMQCFEQLQQLTQEESHWFYTLCEGHVASTNHSDFVTLFKHFKGFIDELNALGVKLPAECKFKFSNFQVELNRLRYIVKNSLYPQAQFDHANGMELNQYGAYYAARYDGYYFVADEMSLSEKLPTGVSIDYKVELKDVKSPTSFYRYCGRQAYAKSFDYYVRFITALQAKNTDIAKLYPLLTATMFGQRVYNKLPDNINALIEKLLVVCTDTQWMDAWYQQMLDITPPVSLTEFLSLYVHFKNQKDLDAAQFITQLNENIRYYKDYFFAAVDRQTIFNDAMSFSKYMSILGLLRDNKNIGFQRALSFILASCAEDTSSLQIQELCTALNKLQGDHFNILLGILAGAKPNDQLAVEEQKHAINIDDLIYIANNFNPATIHKTIKEKMPYVTIGANPHVELFTLLDINKLMLDFKDLLPQNDLRQTLVFLVENFPNDVSQYKTFISVLQNIQKTLPNTVKLLLGAAEKVKPGLQNFSLAYSTSLLTQLGEYFKKKKVVAPKVFSGVLLDESLTLDLKGNAIFMSSLSKILNIPNLSEAQLQQAIKVNLMAAASKIQTDLSNFFEGVCPPKLLTPCLIVLDKLLSVNKPEVEKYISGLTFSIVKLMKAFVNQDLLSSLLLSYQSSPEKLVVLLDELAQDFPRDRLDQYLDILLKLNTTIPNALRDKLANISPAQFAKIVSLYHSKPYPNLDTLKTLVEIKPQDFDNEVKLFECNPHGAREFEEQFATDRVLDTLCGISDPSTDTHLSMEDQRNLLDDFRFVNYIGKRHFAEKSASELNDQFKKCADLLRANPGHRRARLALLALAREALYRTTNLFANSTQMQALILLLEGEHVLAKKDGGQGKTLIAAISALYSWIETGHVDITTTSMYLAETGFEVFQPFFAFFDIPCNVITVDSPLDSYDQPGIHYSTRGEKVLFTSRCRFEGGTIPKNKSLIIDEADDVLYDDAQRYNFAMNISGIDDHHYNPYAWIYPLINDFIDSDEFKNDQATIIDDINNALAYLSLKATPTQREQLKKDITPMQIDSWIESAVAARDSVRENVHYVVKTEERLINGHEQPVQYARILVNGRPNLKAQWSYGVHQFLHARFNSKKQDERLPDCPVDPEHTFVDSTTNKDFLLEYSGRIIALSATPGSKPELAEAKEKYNYKVIGIPSHQTSMREDLPPIFAKNREAQFAYILKQIEICQKLKQPILILAEDIEESEALFEKIKSTGISADNMQLVNAKQGSERKAVERAGNPGMVTVSTDMLGRGVDIIAQDIQDKIFVLPTHYCDERQEIQSKARTDRQGRGGQTRYIINSERFDKVHGNRFPGNAKHRYTTEGLFAEIRHERFIHQQKQRYVREKLSDIRANISHQFYAMLPDINQANENDKRACLQNWNQLLSQFDAHWHMIFDETSTEKDLYAVSIDQLKAKLTEFEVFANAEWTKLQQTINRLIPGMKPAQVVQPERKDFTVNIQKKEKHKVIYADKYDPAHDGRPTVYTRFLEGLRAIFRGERKLFANFRAALRGEGVLFANTRSFFRGDIPFLASIRAWFSKLWESFQSKRNKKKTDEHKAQLQVEPDTQQESSYQRMYEQVFVGAQLLPEEKAEGQPVTAATVKNDGKSSIGSVPVRDLSSTVTII